MLKIKANKVKAIAQFHPFIYLFMRRTLYYLLGQVAVDGRLVAGNPGPESTTNTLSVSTENCSPKEPALTKSPEVSSVG